METVGIILIYIPKDIRFELTAVSSSSAIATTAFLADIFEKGKKQKEMSVKSQSLKLALFERYSLCWKCMGMFIYFAYSLRDG